MASPAWKVETRSRNLFGKLLGHLHSAKERPTTCHVASVFGWLQGCVHTVLLLLDGVSETRKHVDYCTFAAMVWESLGRCS